MKEQQTIISVSDLSTEHGREYLSQLCNHLIKRVQVEVEGQTARIRLPIGTCELAANKTAINVQVRATTDHIDRMEAVFGGLIERYAFRENVNLMWQRAMLTKGN